MAVKLKTGACRLDDEDEHEIYPKNRAINESVHRDQNLEDISPFKNYNGVNWDAILDLFLKERRR